MANTYCVVLLFEHGDVQHILCCVFVLLFLVLCPLAYQFLWVVFVLFFLVLCYQFLWVVFVLFFLVVCYQFPWVVFVLFFLVLCLIFILCYQEQRVLLVER